MLILLFLFIFFIFLLFLKKYYQNYFNILKSLILILITTLFVFFIVLYPKEIIDASKEGIIIWFNAVLPSLLPFFIGAELLIGLGVVKFIGILIEPIIRPLFNVPGEASFIFTMSITSGYPMGVKLTSNLSRKGILNKVEAQRIISFCSTSGPLFIIGAVAIGMFNDQYIGPYMAIAHYLGAITVGLIFRFYKCNYNTHSPSKINNKNMLKIAFSEMLKAKKQDGRTFGKLLSDSIKESLSTIFLIGGIIVLFSVIIKELTVTGIIDSIYNIIKNLINNDNITRDLFEGIITGCVEITMGCKFISELSNLSNILKVTLATMIISWSGISVHAQAASFLSDTKINITTYIISKFIHSVVSGIYVFIILNFIDYKHFSKKSIEVFSYGIQNISQYPWLKKIILSSKMFIIMVFILVLMGFVIQTLKVKRY